VYSSSRMYTLAFDVVVVRELDVSSMEYTTRMKKGTTRMKKDTTRMGLFYLYSLKSFFLE
jgi:hypothetical protein